MRALMWFRADLRVADNTALFHACRQATRGVIATFIVCPDQWQEHDWADIKVEFIRRTLEELSVALEKLHIPLLIRKTENFDGVPDVLFETARKLQCDGLFFNAEYEVNESRRDLLVTERFAGEGLDVFPYTDQVVISPGSVRTGKGDFYTVFTPFKKSWLAKVGNEGVPSALSIKRQPDLPTAPDPIPTSIAGFEKNPAGIDLWPVGERAASQRLGRFVQGRIEHYKEHRNQPAIDGTSGLSPYLTVGALSVRECLRAAVQANDGLLEGGSSGTSVWISELIWREFYRHVIVGFPRVSMHRAFRRDTEKIRWREDRQQFEAWCRGAPVSPSSTPRCGSF